MILNGPAQRVESRDGVGQGRFEALVALHLHSVRPAVDHHQQFGAAKGNPGNRGLGPPAQVDRPPVDLRHVFHPDHHAEVTAGVPGPGARAHRHALARIVEAHQPDQPGPVTSGAEQQGLAACLRRQSPRRCQRRVERASPLRFVTPDPDKEPGRAVNVTDADHDLLPGLLGDRLEVFFSRHAGSGQQDSGKRVRNP